MKIGILHSYIPGQDACGIKENHVDRMKAFFLEHDQSFTFEVFESTLQALPEDLDTCDAYVLTGSKFGVYEEHAWLPALQNWIVRANEQKKKMIGICFGHQILAQALGGKVVYGNTGYMLGIYHAHFEVPSYAQRLTRAWLPEPSLNCEIHYAHQDYVTTLPQGAVNILSSPHCNNAGYIIGHHILTFQGHPEYTDEYVKTVLTTHAGSLPPETVQSAEKTLREHSADRKIFQTLCVNFLNDRGQ